jgi:hypothetical protein
MQLSWHTSPTEPPKMRYEDRPKKGFPLQPRTHVVLSRTYEKLSSYSLNLPELLEPKQVGDRRTRTRTNTHPNDETIDSEANATGRRGVRVGSTNGTCENQGA